MNPLFFIFFVTISVSVQAVNQRNSPELKKALTLRQAAQSAVNRANAAIAAAENKNHSPEKRNKMIGVAIQKSQTAGKKAREALTETKSVLRQAEEAVRESQDQRETFFDAKMRAFRDEDQISAKTALRRVSSVLRERRNRVMSIRSDKVIATHIETQAQASLKKARALRSLQNTSSSCHQAVSN